MNRKPPRGAGLGVLLAVAAACAMPGPVLAHAALVRAVPGSRAVVSRMPDKLELCFNEAVEVKFSTVKLLDAKEQPLALGPPQAVADNPKCLTAAAPAAGPGTYTLRYHVLSRDGHLVDYGYRFTVGPAAGPQ
ncbi:MAG: copper resistance protein CopC [Nevskia sp.]|nr:copper resistance protein CopC [Nevskia sp.]